MLSVERILTLNDTLADGSSATCVKQGSRTALIVMSEHPHLQFYIVTAAFNFKFTGYACY